MSPPDEPAPFYVRARCLILGCGNLLFGDDGFGPMVAQRLEAEGLPEWAAVMDAGTGVRKILFNLLLSQKQPALVIIADAVDRGRRPGETFWISLDEIPAIKTDDFSMHQAPTSNLLKELRDQGGINIEVLACQPGFIPAEVDSRLSPQVAGAVETACAMIRNRLSQFGPRPDGEEP